jgi:hypothetical protein
MQLGSALDKTQVEYFSKLMEQLEADDRIILCNAEPYWLYSTLYKNDPAFDNRNMEFFEGYVLQNRTAVYIAGEIRARFVIVGNRIPPAADALTI